MCMLHRSNAKVRFRGEIGMRRENFAPKSVKNAIFALSSQKIASGLRLRKWAVRLRNHFPKTLSATTGGHGGDGDGHRIAIGLDYLIGLNWIAIGLDYLI
jgi:hypothetical protein